MDDKWCPGCKSFTAPPRDKWRRQCAECYKRNKRNREYLWRLTPEAKALRRRGVAWHHDEMRQAKREYYARPKPKRRCPMCRLHRRDWPEGSSYCRVCRAVKQTEYRTGVVADDIVDLQRSKCVGCKTPIIDYTGHARADAWLTKHEGKWWLMCKTCRKNPSTRYAEELTQKYKDLELQGFEPKPVNQESVARCTGKGSRPQGALDRPGESHPLPEGPSTKTSDHPNAGDVTASERPG
jgi:hypothetical protein